MLEFLLYLLFKDAITAPPVTPTPISPPEIVLELRHLLGIELKTRLDRHAIDTKTQFNTYGFNRLSHSLRYQKPIRKIVFITTLEYSDNRSLEISSERCANILLPFNHVIESFYQEPALFGKAFDRSLVPALAFYAGREEIRFPDDIPDTFMRQIQQHTLVKVIMKSPTGGLSCSMEVGSKGITHHPITSHSAIESPTIDKKAPSTLQNP